MKKLAELFGSSSRELKSVRTITVCAMLAAAAIILVNFRIELTNTQRIGFSGIPNQLVAYLFGPAVSCLFAGALDIIKYLIKPVGAFFPGFTVSALLGGVIYGMVPYKRPLSLKRVIAATALVTVFVNLLLNTYLLTVLEGRACGAHFPARIMKEAVLLPIDILLYYTIARVLGRARVFHGLQGAAR